MRASTGILFTLLLAAVTTAWGQPNRIPVPLLGTDPILSSPARVAEISWQTEARDLGFRNVGEEIVTTFRFRNTGSDYLRIEGISSSSTQGRATYVTEEIAPGASSEIKLHVRPTKAGAFQVYFTVTSNTRAIAHVLTLRGIGR